MNYLIGIDIGTSSTKTLMMDEAGRIVASASYEYPLYQPKNGWAEQDPEDWKNAALQTLQQVIKKSGVSKDAIAGIGLSGQMHGLVMLDAENKPIRSSIIWCDQRSDQQVEKMLEILPLEKWLEITANPPIAAWTAAKIMWIRDHEPETYAKCKKILLPKDYIRFVLTGVFATDVSDASGMQLLDVKNRCWSEEVLAKLGIDPTLLGTVYESQEITGNVLPEIAEACGLSTETIVVAGASDNAAAAVGTGIVKKGLALTSIGTSAIVYTHLDEYVEIPNGSLHICCCAVPGCWHSMGGPQSAGLSIKWFIDNFCQDYEQKAAAEGKNVFELLYADARKIPVGSDKLIFLPYLMGERTPRMDPFCRGAFIGINASHTKAHFFRAIVEGVTYSLADCNNILKDVGVDVTAMRVCGGGSRNPVWREIMADLYECQVISLANDEGPAYGVAILAGVATGIFPSIQEACERFVQENDSTTWDTNRAATYKKYHELYGKLYWDLKKDFNQLAKL